MRLQDIFKNPSSALNYLERIVNDGSKSGFTNIHTTSKETNPLYSESYRVKKIYYDNKKIRSYGNLPSFCKSKFDDENIYIHPDWLLRDDLNFKYVEDAEVVIPTSSSRTVKILNSNYYLKLCYPGKLGRLYRNLEYPHLMSSIELTNLLEKMKKKQNAPIKFEFMPEIGGKILYDENKELGYIVRSIPDNIVDSIVIPGFSLFSKDKFSLEDEALIVQILYLKDNKKEFFLENFCYPLIDIFFYCALNEGIILEMHSQNVLFSFDQNWDVYKIVLRDLESADKDLTIRESLKKTNKFLSYPYKCISVNDRDYYLRHSFMYDHKLCEYLIDPLIECISNKFNLNKTSIKKNIKEYVNLNYNREISRFFPEDGLWYKYPNIEIDRSTKRRPFISFENPQYR